MHIFVNPLVALSMVMVACAADTRLEPAPLTRTVNGKLAVERLLGVRVADESEVSFQLTLVHAEDETVFGTVGIDFLVVR